MTKIIPKKFELVTQPDDNKIHELSELDNTHRLREILVHYGKDFYNNPNIVLRTAGFNGGLPLHLSGPPIIGQGVK